MIQKNLHNIITEKICSMLKPWGSKSGIIYMERAAEQNEGQDVPTWSHCCASNAKSGLQKCYKPCWDPKRIQGFGWLSPLMWMLSTTSWLREWGQRRRVQPLHTALVRTLPNCHTHRYWKAGEIPGLPHFTLWGNKNLLISLKNLSCSLKTLKRIISDARSLFNVSDKAVMRFIYPE